MPRPPRSASAIPTRVPRDAWLLPVLEELVEPSRLAELGGSDSIWESAVDGGLATDESIVRAAARRFRTRAADLTTIDDEARAMVPEWLARRHAFVPLGATSSTIDIAVADPNDLDCERSVGFATGRAVRMMLASSRAIARRLDELYRPDRAVDVLLDGLEDHDVRAPDDAFSLGVEKSGDRPFIRLVDHILAEGIALKASDIHLESAEDGVRVVYRVDGVLRAGATLPRAVGVPLVSRIKIMSALDIADRLRPQDGRARVMVDGRRVDLRVSTLPAAAGEKVVIRVLDATSTVLSLEALGLVPADLGCIRQLVQLREGLVLVTGPTGSGKTTTLYAALRTIMERGVNVVTVEDPVEYKLPGVVQVQVNERAGLTFATALRSILRQDPDVVLVGEIRDRETATIAVQASLTGHLVLSTLHTIDAPSSITRLLDIGVEGYKIAAAVKGVVAQRLVRRICADCRHEAIGSAAAGRVESVAAEVSRRRTGGCERCAHSGYRGRVAITEVLTVAGDVERGIAAGESAERIGAAARRGGMRSMWDSGMSHVLAGVTDVEELLRVAEPPPPGESGGHDATAAVPVAGEEFDLLEDPERRGRAAMVLVAHGDEVERAALRSRLEDEGFGVADVSDGVAALEAVDSVAPEAVVLSMRLARADGVEVLRRLRARLPTAHLPVVLLAGSADEEREVEALAAGADDFALGPVRERALMARLRSLIGRRRR